MPHPRTDPRFIVALALAFAPAALGAASGAAGGVTVDGPAGARLRIEALDPHVVRIWLKPSGDFERQPSLAMETAPAARSPVARADSGDEVAVETGALTVTVNRGTLAFGVRASGGGPALLADARIAAHGAGGPWTLTDALAPSERLFGLGQDNHNNGRLDRRGVVRDLWAGQQINSGNVTAQYPVPFLLSTGRDGHAYGIFFDNVHRLLFDLGKTQADQLRLDSDGGEIDFYVIDGPRLADVIERYTGLTGRPSLPPLWALGYWQSKCTYYDWDALDEAYHQLTARGFPVDVMVIDADWPEVVTDYVWAKRWIDTGHGLSPAEKIAAYARKGVRIVVSQSGPMIQEASPTFAPGWAMGVFATDGKGNPVEAGYYGGKLLDFTHPRINEWLWPQTRRLNEQGVAGWWLDLDEPEGEPPQTHYYAGGPPDIHNEYSLLCTLSFEGVQLSVHPQQRPFILSRAGPAGFQRHHAAVWTGDIYSDYATYRAHPPEMLNSGLSGLAYWTCDTGGFLTGYYKDDQLGAHARLYERWMQFSAFSPITRAHKAGGAPEPYAFGPATEQGTKHYLQQRYRLLPYIYSYAWEASRKGLPIVRPMALEFPDDAAAVATPGDQYLFGRELLVAPVLFEGQSNRKVYFPPGTWIDWDYGYDYAGGRDWVVAAPQNRIPVAVRAGAIIPMAPDMKNTAEKPWDPLTLEVFPSGKSEFTLYSDDGRTFAYEKGESTTTRFACDDSGGGIRLTIAESNKRFTPREYRARFHLREAPVAVAVDGERLATGGWSWDAQERVLSVSIAAGRATDHALTVELDGHPLPARLAPTLAAVAIDTTGEAAGSGGEPTPHFFPAPALPAVIKASNYDNGGEGIAFHSTRPAPANRLYRDDDFGLAPTSDAGGGYALTGLKAGEWARYTIDCGNGGYFDVSVRAASARGGGRIRLVALDQTLATVEVPATGGADAFRDFRFPGVYLNPGELALLVYVEAQGAALNTISIEPAAVSPSTYPAALAFRRGVADVTGRGEAGHELGYIRNLGRAGSSVTFGVSGRSGGPRNVRLHYSSSQAGPVAITLAVGNGAPVKLPVAPTAGAWRLLDVPVTLEAGANRIQIEGHEEGWNSIQLAQIEVLPR
jgi:alpha-glucosidase